MKYLVDTRNLTGYSQVVAELNVLDDGKLKQIRTNTFTNEIKSQHTANANSPNYLQTDALGSIRSLTSSESSEQYNYTAFGSKLQGSGSLTNYAFTGQRFDDKTNLQYHRARWYIPQLGTFPSVDQFEGVIQRPETLFKYLYSHMNPVNASDPSGLFFDSISTKITAAVQGILNATAIPSFWFAVFRTLLVQTFTRMSIAFYFWLINSTLVSIVGGIFAIANWYFFMTDPEFQAIVMSMGAITPGGLSQILYYDCVAIVRGVRAIPSGLSELYGISRTLLEEIGSYVKFHPRIKFQPRINMGIGAPFKWVKGKVPRLWKNQLPELLATELEMAADMGVVRMKIDNPSFARMLGQEKRLKFIVYQDGRVYFVPEQVGRTEIYHSVASKGEDVVAAGECVLKSTDEAGVYIGKWINDQSGHYFNHQSAEGVLDIAKEAFANLGILFPK